MICRGGHDTQKRRGANALYPIQALWNPSALLHQTQSYFQDNIFDATAMMAKTAAFHGRISAGIVVYAS